jgi:type I restriction enzyme S subunit
VRDDEERRLVRELIDQIVPGSEVWVFGSRATGRVWRGSDLDLLFTWPVSLTWQQRAALADAFESSTLPFRVDLVDAASLARDYAERVQAERVAL